MIRNASPADAQIIAQLIVLAMGKLAAKFANSTEPEKALELFEHFAALTGNQYSYENILVYDNGVEVCGMIMAYDGGQLDLLRKPFLEYTTAQLGFTGQPEDETQSGEYYIDCLAVSPQYQGKGIAKALLTALVAKAKTLNHYTVGLLVSKGNDNAKRLYTGLGFKVKGDKTLLGGVHEHLQYEIL